MEKALKSEPLLWTAQEDGAWPNGSIVVKCNGRPTDGTPDGMTGKLLGSLYVGDQGKPARFAYCLEWANRPGLPVFCVDINDDGSPRLELRS